MNRPLRIALNTLAPPLIAALLLSAFMFVDGSFNPSDLPLRIGKFTAFAVFYAYVAGFIPSAMHALIMEGFYRRFPAYSFRACVLSSGNGFLAGVAISLFFFSRSSSPITFEPSMLILPALGLVTGFVIGMLIKFLSRRTHTTQSLESRCQE